MADRLKLPPPLIADRSTTPWSAGSGRAGSGIWQNAPHQLVRQVLSSLRSAWRRPGDATKRVGPRCFWTTEAHRRVVSTRCGRVISRCRRQRDFSSTNRANAADAGAARPPTIAVANDADGSDQRCRTGSPVGIFQHDEVRVLRIAVQSTRRAPSATRRAASEFCSPGSATCRSKWSRG